MHEPESPEASVSACIALRLISLAFSEIDDILRMGNQQRRVPWWPTNGGV